MLLAILDIDKTLFLWCNQFQTKANLIRLFRWISHTGDGYMYVAIGLTSYFIDEKIGEIFLATGLLAYAFEVPLFITLKKLVKRDRPFVNIPSTRFAITPSDKFSLPSGHSAAAFLMASLIAVYYPQYIAIAFIWASLIGLSRVMLGVHYPTDILAGATLGCLCTLMSIAILA